MDKDRESALVGDCQRGDRQALDTLVRHFQQSVYNAAYRMLGNMDEAADVTQTTFMKLFENIGRFDDSYRLFSWIYRIALNEAINQLKRRKQTEPLDEPFADRDVLHDDFAAAQLGSSVQKALMDLHEDHRTVIVLHYFTDCSYQEIAEVLELPVKTVKSRLFTARQQLKRRLQQIGVFQ